MKKKTNDDEPLFRIRYVKNKPSEYLCKFNYNKDKKSKINMKKKLKRLNPKVKKKNNKQKLPTEAISDTKVWIKDVL
jgi:hypothetical protein